MNMFDKKGNLTPVARSIFNSGMERLRNNEDPLSIVNDLIPQLKLVEYTKP